MKVKLLPIAVAGVALSGAAVADVSIYGKINMTYNALEREAENTLQDNYDLNSNNSRFGIEAKTKITDTLNAIAKLEWAVDVDGDTSELSQRNQYVGLQGNFGTLLGGRHDTPLKLAEGKIDRFNDLPYGDIQNVFVGQNRESNIVMYRTPSFGGFSAAVAAIPGSDSGKDGVKNQDDGPADYVSASVNFTSGNLALALAYDDDILGSDTLRAVAEYKIGDFGFGAMYQDAEEHDDGDGISRIRGPLNDLANETGLKFEEQEGFLISADWTLNKLVFKVQYAYAESDAANNLGTAETTQWIGGVDYNLAKSTTLLAYYANIETDAGDFNVDDVEWNTFGVGMIYKF